MKHYGPEPPWRGYSRWYGEWKQGPELYEGGFLWTLLPAEAPGSFLGQLSRVLRGAYLDALVDLTRPAYGLKEQLERVQ